MTFKVLICNMIGSWSFRCSFLLSLLAFFVFWRLSVKDHEKAVAGASGVFRFLMSAFVLLANLLMPLAYFFIVSYHNINGLYIYDVIGALWIVLCWRLIAETEKRINQDKGMGGEALKLANILALCTIILASIIMAMKENLEYSHLASITIALLIGSYIPIDDYFCTGPITRLKKRFKLIKDSINADRFYKITYGIITIIILISFVFFKDSTEIKEITGYSGMGLVSGIIVFLVIIVAKTLISEKRKAKCQNK